MNMDMDMDMDSMSMSMSSTSTASSTMSSSTSMSGMDMGGMDMNMGGCQIQMLWNWNTIGACFLSQSWHITSRGMFAGSCIGVICLVLVLEFLRRIGREYDSFIVRRARLRRRYLEPAKVSSSSITSAPVQTKNDQTKPTTTEEEPVSCCAPAPQPEPQLTTPAPPAPTALPTYEDGPFRPSPIEQLVRALLHMLQFAVAYFIMLLAMYFNGYIIICIFIGAFLGAFIFSWEPITLGKETDAMAVTKCCG